MLTELRTIQSSSERVTQLAWSPESGTLLAARIEGAVDLLNIETGTVIRTLECPHDCGLTTFASSYGGGILASATDECMMGTITLWDVLSGRCWETEGYHVDFVNGLTFSPNDTLLASAADDVKIWEVPTGRELHTLDGYSAVAFSPDGKDVASIGKGKGTSSDYSAVKIWDVSTGQLKALLQGTTTSIWQMAFTPDGRRIVTIGDRKPPQGAGIPERHNCVAIWDLASQQEVITWYAGQHLMEMTIHPDGKMLATRGYYPRFWAEPRVPEIVLWEIETGDLLEKTIVGERHQSLAFSPDGNRLAASADSTIYIWSVER